MRFLLNFFLAVNNHFFLAAEGSTPGTTTNNTEWLDIIDKFLQDYRLPFSIVLIVAAAFMAIFIGVAIAREEDSGKAAALKKRLYGLIWTIVLVLVLMWVLSYVISIWPTIQGHLDDFKGSLE